MFTAAVGIGKYNGGGMKQLPDAIVDDGLLDMTVIRKISNFDVIMNIRSLYKGVVSKLPQASYFQGKQVVVVSDKDTNIEVDGEALGYSPFTFENINQAITVVVGEKFNVRE